MGQCDNRKQEQVGQAGRQQRQAVGRQWEGQQLCSLRKVEVAPMGKSQHRGARRIHTGQGENKSRVDSSRPCLRHAHSGDAGPAEADC